MEVNMNWLAPHMSHLNSPFKIFWGTLGSERASLILKSGVLSLTQTPPGRSCRYWANGAHLDKSGFFIFISTSPLWEAPKPHGTYRREIIHQNSEAQESPWWLIGSGKPSSAWQAEKCVSHWRFQPYDALFLECRAFMSQLLTHIWQDHPYTARDPSRPLVSWRASCFSSFCFASSPSLCLKDMNILKEATAIRRLSFSVCNFCN